MVSVLLIRQAIKKIIIFASVNSFGSLFSFLANLIFVFLSLLLL